MPSFSGPGATLGGPLVFVLQKSEKTSDVYSANGDCSKAAFVIELRWGQLTLFLVVRTDWKPPVDRLHRAHGTTKWNQKQHSLSLFVFQERSQAFTASTSHENPEHLG